MKRGLVLIAIGVSCVCFLVQRVAATEILELVPQTSPGLIAKQDVVLKGNFVRFDSFDSADPDHDNPLNPDEIKAGGGVATFVGNISIGHGSIHGRVFTGTNGTLSIGVLGSVGPLDWTGPGLFSPDWHVSNYDLDYKNVDPPFDRGFVPMGGGTNYWVLNYEDYLVNGDVDLNHKVILVTGLARLYVTGSFSMRGASEIKILPGATLKVYVGTMTGPDTTASFAKISTPGNAAVFQYYGLPSNKSVAWNGEVFYAGTIYAPQATLSLGSGGADVRHFMGACIVNEAVLNGRLHFHYDENLRKD